MFLLEQQEDEIISKISVLGSLGVGNVLLSISNYLIISIGKAITVIRVHDLGSL